MMVREDIFDKLTTEPVTKIHAESVQGDINLLEQELAEKEAKMKPTKDVIERKEIRFFSSGIRKTYVWCSHWQPSNDMGPTRRPRELQ